jgi:amidase
LPNMGRAPLPDCAASGTSRRRFLGGTAGVAAALALCEPILTACRSGRNSSPPATVLPYQTASEVTEEIVNRQLSARQVSEYTLDRIGDINPRVNAVIALAKDEMFAAAEKVDRDDASGALAGVPVTIKEAINVAGLPTTWGNPEWKENVATTDATVVSRLRAAGALIAGKTNVAFMLGDIAQTTNPLFGLTRNPWNLDRATGGSSGGSAAAVAAGLSCLDIGSDLGGSIRIPAALCGVYGLKPTPGMVPLAGFQPPEGSTATLLNDIAVLGPLARSAKDIRLALQVIAGPIPPATMAYQWSLSAPRHSRLTDFRVGVILDDPAGRTTSEVGTVLSDLIDDLSAYTATVVQGWPKGFDPRISQATFDGMIDDYLFFQFGEANPTARLSDLIDRDEQRTKLQTLWQEYFADVDVFVCPTTFTTAPRPDDRPIDQRTISTTSGQRSYRDLAAWISHPSIAGLPALTVPAGLAADGLPVGLQVIGSRYDDNTVITFAELLADEIGGYRPPAV